MEKTFLVLLSISFAFLLVSVSYILLAFKQFRRATCHKSNEDFLTAIPTRPTSTQDYEVEILYAVITEQLKAINDKLLAIHKILGNSTRTEIISEIEQLRSQLSQFEEKTEVIKTEYNGKKQEVKLRILETFTVIDQIKQLLEIDYENLVAQRDYLKDLLKKQEFEYKHLAENYSSEIEKLSAIIDDLKQRYPEQLTTRLNIQVMNKAKVLESLQEQYEQLKKTTKEKLSILDEVLTKKSSEIEKFITSLKQQGEQEIIQLKNEIDYLRDEVAQLDIEVKRIVKDIHSQKHEKDEIIKRMKTEIEYLRKQEAEIINLKLREEYLNNEIQKLNLEYEKLQREFGELTRGKAKQIKQLHNYSEHTVRQILTEWENQKSLYEGEIRRLKRRQAILQKRKQRIIEIQNKLTDHYKTEQEKLNREVTAKKQELEKLSRQTREEISARINKIEGMYSQLKRRIEVLKSELSEKIKQYDDKILEVKQRSKIREERIRRNIEKYKHEYESLLREIGYDIERSEQEVRSTIANVLSEKNRMEAQRQLRKEQLETYLEEISKMTAKIEIIRIEADKFEQEINNKQQQIISRFDELLNSIGEQKQQLIYKLENMLKLQDEVIMKLPQKISEKK